MHYFTMHPTVSYDIHGDGTVQPATNITSRVKFDALMGGIALLYYPYRIKDAERADHIAFKYYKDERYDWLVYLSNDIFDPYTQWPLDAAGFAQHITDVYGSSQNAQQTVHHYEWILDQARKEFLPDGSQVIVPERTVVVDLATYITKPVDSKRSVSMYEYEDRLNEARRSIRILDKSYVTTVERQLRLLYPNA